MTDPMIPRDRCDYSAIVDRPTLKLPGDTRIVIWTIVNLEVWDIGKPMARQVLPAPEYRQPPPSSAISRRAYVICSIRVFAFDLNQTFGCVG
jgi:hypothetical protein